jgi:hypothetical protein
MAGCYKLYSMTVQDRAYAQACRMVIPELGSSMVLAYEDSGIGSSAPAGRPAECRFSLHLAIAPIPAARLSALAPTSAGGQADEHGPSLWKRMAKLCFLNNDDLLWQMRYSNSLEQESWHCRMFVEPTQRRVWEAASVGPTWPLSVGMRPLFALQ